MSEPVVVKVPETEVESPPPPRRFWLVDWLRSNQMRWLLLLALYVIIQPPEKGLGSWGVPELCACKRYTGGPCPGCGMTRAGANMIRGNFKRSFQFHPFGIVFIPMLFGFATLSLLPKTVRYAMADGVERRVRWFRITYSFILVAFLVFGLIRWVLVMADVVAFPLDWP